MDAQTIAGLGFSRWQAIAKHSRTRANLTAYVEFYAEVYFGKANTWAEVVRVEVGRAQELAAGRVRSWMLASDERASVANAKIQIDSAMEELEQ